MQPAHERAAAGRLRKVSGAYEWLDGQRVRATSLHRRAPRATKRDRHRSALEANRRQKRDSPLARTRRGFERFSEKGAYSECPLYAPQPSTGFIGRYRRTKP